LKNKIKLYIKKWEKRDYKNNFPNEVNKNLELLLKVPSYRMVCRTILMNDNQCVSLGFTRKNCDLYSNIKHDEIMNRNKNNNEYQLELF
jgi:predicted phosphoadenosine phosphosulfate sulfurtransferase